MCSGRVDLEFVFRAFSRGTDGVFIGGCRLNECNYTTHGNYHALNMALLGKKIMSHLGLNPDRLMIEFMSSGEGILFAEVVNDFSRQVASLGPLGSSEGLSREELNAKLQEVRKLIPYIKMAKKEKLEARLANEEEYESFYTADEIARLFNEIPTYHIDSEKCQACMICLRKCPVQAILGGKNQVHVIDQDKCIKCGTCFDACPSRFSAVTETSGGSIPPQGPEEPGKVAGLTH